MTDRDSENRVQGASDIPLNDKGRGQAADWARSLADGGFDLIVTGSLAGTRETAAIINEVLNLPVAEDERLDGQDWGEWTGMTREELRKISTLVRQQEKKGFEFRPKGGESRNELLMRVCDALIDLTENYPGKSVLVVTHDCVLKCLAYALSGLDYLPGDQDPIKPYRLHRVDCLDLELALGELNIEL